MFKKLFVSNIPSTTGQTARTLSNPVTEATINLLRCKIALTELAQGKTAPAVKPVEKHALDK